MKKPLARLQYEIDLHTITRIGVEGITINFIITN